MNSIEEKLWNYIDGACTSDEQKQISHLIAHDEEYQRIYKELMQFHNEFDTLELDEPPMAFTYKVMEQIRAQEASVPLKTAVNKYVIGSIATFFVGTIVVLLLVAFDYVGQPTGQPVFQLPQIVTASHPEKYFTTAWLNGFLLFDIVLGLFLFDAYLRKHSQHYPLNDHKN